MEAGLTAGSDELASRTGERVEKALGALVGLVVLTACSIQGDPIVGEGPTGRDYPTGPTSDNTCFDDPLENPYAHCTTAPPTPTPEPTGSEHHVPTMTECRALERRAAMPMLTDTWSGALGSG